MRHQSSYIFNVSSLSSCPSSFQWIFFQEPELRSLRRLGKKILRTFGQLGAKILSRPVKGGGEWNMWWAYKFSFCENKSNWSIFGAKNARNIWNWKLREICDWKCEENVSCDQISKLRIKAADFPSSWGTLSGENILESSLKKSEEFFMAANLERFGWAAFAKMRRAAVKAGPQTISFGKSAN